MGIKKFLLIVLVLVLIYTSLIYIPNNLEKLLNTWGKIHTRSIEWLEQNIFPKTKEWFEPKKEILIDEFEKEKQEMGKDLKELNSKLFSGLLDFIKDIF